MLHDSSNSTSRIAIPMNNDIRSIFSTRVQSLHICVYLTLFALCAGWIHAVAPAPSEGYELVWSDEFATDGAPDPANWVYEHGFVRNEEAQWYQPENAFCENGYLVIEGRRERKPNPRYRPGGRDWKTRRPAAEYTSACLKTVGLHSWQYGRFEVRAKIQAKAGLWPAIWFLGEKGPWPECGEIDLMEYYRDQLLANACWGSPKAHAPVWDSSKTPMSEIGGPDWDDSFHVWRMDWDRDWIRLYVDDRLLNEIDVNRAVNESGRGAVTHPFRQPHYLLLNLAISGTEGGDPSATVFPSRYEIDYVRVYQRSGAPPEK